MYKSLRNISASSNEQISASKSANDQEMISFILGNVVWVVICPRRPLLSYVFPIKPVLETTLLETPEHVSKERRGKHASVVGFDRVLSSLHLVTIGFLRFIIGPMMDS